MLFVNLYAPSTVPCILHYLAGFEPETSQGYIQYCSFPDSQSPVLPHLLPGSPDLRHLGRNAPNRDTQTCKTTGFISGIFENLRFGKNLKRSL